MTYRLATRLAGGLALLFMLAPSAARAQARPAPAPAKQPPPPLFPRHRRGVYRDSQGLETIDATPQSPPLETDDPSVPDKGEYEINLTTQADLAKEEKAFNLLFVDANYGVLPKVAGHELPTQLKFEVPLAAARERDEPYVVGIGPAKAGIKFNFYTNERSGVAIAFYPQVEFEAPGSGGIEKGLTEPGQTLVLPLLVAREFHYFTFVGNGAINKAVHDADRETTATLSAAVGRAFTRKVAVMMELRNESAVTFKSNHLMFLNVGLIHGVRHVIVYTNVGHSLYSDDGSGHTYLGVGMKFVVNERKQ